MKNRNNFYVVDQYGVRHLNNYVFKGVNGEEVLRVHSIPERDADAIELIFNQVKDSKLSSYHLGILTDLIDSMR